MQPTTVLLAGASGFVGRHAAVALGAAGYRVRGLSRSVDRARASAPELEWFEWNPHPSSASARTSLAKACEGTTIAVYLLHAIGSSRDYDAEEANLGRAFSEAVDAAGVERIVYLGGVVPSGPRSRHLESRRLTGELLAGSKAQTIELRASMVIGHASASFTLIRDLAVRLPMIALPSWLDRRSYPIAVCDVAAAIALACQVSIQGSRAFDLPGPECVSHRRLIGYLTGPLGTRLLERRIDAITPWLAALGIAAVSRVPAALSRELVAGLTSDLCPTGPVFWDTIGRPALRPLRHAIVDALSDEFDERSPSDVTRRHIAKKTVDWLELLPSHD